MPAYNVLGEILKWTATAIEALTVAAAGVTVFRMLL
jgi:hypothetical protein